MWIADRWKDYEVIDTSNGEKLERWGNYILVRPDPQVIWNTPHKEPRWKQKNGHYHRSNRGGGEWEFFDLPKTWKIHYGELAFHLQPFQFKHTGLFPEQAVNWDWFGDKIRQANRPIKVLNYDGIIMDPPSYGRGPKGEIWKIEEKIFPFVELCTKVLSKDPLFFLINSYTTGLQPAVLSYMMNTALVPKFGGHVDAQEIGLPVSSNGLVLPCGASGRWERSKS